MVGLIWAGPPSGQGSVVGLDPAAEPPSLVWHVAGTRCSQTGWIPAIRTSHAVASASAPRAQLRRTYPRSHPALSLSIVGHPDLARDNHGARIAVDLGGLRDCDQHTYEFLVGASMNHSIYWTCGWEEIRDEHDEVLDFQT